jgi:hypothetical protein
MKRIFNIRLAALLLVVAAVALFYVGCSQQPTEPTTSTPVLNVPDNPSTPTDLRIIDVPFISTDSMGMSLDPASIIVDSTGILDRMIAKMDPYVTTDSDRAYTLDYASFLKNEGTHLSFEERKIAENLSQCVPIANANITEMRRSPQPAALAAYYSVSWWGVKCCFTGTTAQQIASVVSAGGVVTFQVPVLGAVISLGGISLQMYINAWGGYCFNVPWTFAITRSGVYISRP